MFWCKKFACGWKSIVNKKKTWSMCCFDDWYNDHSSHISHMVWPACENKCSNKFGQYVEHIHFLVLVTRNDVSWRWTEISPVLLHSRRRHAVTTTTAFFRLWSPAVTDHPSIYSRQSHIHSFCRCGMEQPADSRYCCAVTCGLQTAPQDISVFALLPWHCHLTLKLYSSSIPEWT